MAPPPFFFLFLLIQKMIRSRLENHDIIQTVSFVIRYTPTDSSLLNLPLMDIIQFLEENKKMWFTFFSVCL